MDSVPTGRKLFITLQPQLSAQSVHHPASGIPEEPRSRLSDAPDRGFRELRCQRLCIRSTGYILTPLLQPIDHQGKISHYLQVHRTRLSLETWLSMSLSLRWPLFSADMRSGMNCYPNYPSDVHSRFPDEVDQNH
jgi:hypothetical protein